MCTTKTSVSLSLLHIVNATFSQFLAWSVTKIPINAGKIFALTILALVSRLLVRFESIVKAWSTLKHLNQCSSYISCNRSAYVSMINRSNNSVTASFFPFGDPFSRRSSLASNTPPMMILFSLANRESHCCVFSWLHIPALRTWVMTLGTLLFISNYT